MGTNWQRIHVPFVERAVLLELAERWCVSEEEALRRCLRDAAVRELLDEDAEPEQQRETCNA
jgi:hypothetical protein